MRAEQLKSYANHALYLAGLVVVMAMVLLGIVVVSANIAPTDLGGGDEPIKIVQDSPPTPTPTGGGGIQFVKNVGSDQCGDTTSTVTVPAAGVAAGNTLVVVFVVRNTGGVGGTVSVADSGSNTYAIDVDIADSSDQVRTVILSANVGTALVQDDTITVTHPTGTSLGAVVDECSGIASTNWVDATGSGEGNSTTPSASATTTNADDLLYGAVGSQNKKIYTEAASWTTLTHLVMDCGGAPAEANNHTGYRIVSATGSYTYDPTIDNGVKWAAAIASYKGE